MSDMASVIGEVVGQVIGEVLGEESGLEGMSTVGARGRGSLLRLPARQPWRAAAAGLPTGVNAPSDGLEPLPMVPDVQNGIFNALGSPIINFKARPQRPFRGERLLAQVAKVGASALGSFALCSGVFIGTTLQQLQLGGFNIEFFGSNAFGVRLSMSPAAAGLDVTMPINLSAGLVGADTVAVQLLLLGSSVR